MTTAEHERSIKIDQQEFVDDLWAKFLFSGYYQDELGYDLNSIPEKLHVDWGMSCFAVREPSVDSRAVGRPTAENQSNADTGIEFMAQPISPPEPGYRSRSISVASSYVPRSTTRPVQQHPIGGKRLQTQSKSRSPAPPWNRQSGASSSSSSHNTNYTVGDSFMRMRDSYPYTDNRN